MLSGPGEPGMTTAGGIPETKRHQIPTTSESIIESSELIPSRIILPDPEGLRILKQSYK